MNEFHHSRQQEKAFHKLLRECSKLYLFGQGIIEPPKKDVKRRRAYNRVVNTQLEVFKTVAKYRAHIEDPVRFPDILLPSKGSSALMWHDYALLIDIVYKHFPRVFGIEPPPLGKDKDGIY